MKLIKEANHFKIEGIGSYREWYKISEFEFSKIKDILKFLCSQIDEIKIIHIWFLRKHYIEPLAFNNYKDFKRHIKNFSFTNVERVYMNGKKKNKTISIDLSIIDSRVAITTETKELEEEFFNKISGFFNEA